MRPEIITFTGKIVTPFDPKPEQIDIVDIARALSMQCRFTGHTTAFYSVAEHCFNVGEAMEKDGHSARDLLYGLLHDASEAYMADIASPVKQNFPEYKAAESKIQAVIFEAFGLNPVPPAMIKSYDRAALSLEAQELLPPIFMSRYSDELAPPQSNVRLALWPPSVANRGYLQAFDMVMGRIKHAH